ncbi:uncharacterized protein N7511_009229 [Penicillium nucicola]|uniref:uncharacterized protein n=1 Tax=Penicillium nucicola TaxID=1850975 RepID=UPI0025458B99|nr:uncharacterized protein N7511_009229 [Penicillium nucicola]KAJ5747533.1 hypothetical protein N7511_009229 [Penicillium nucicola]
MSSTRDSPSAQKWRVSKACEPCRSRKIRCDGNTPCSKCTERSFACIYREKPRRRPKRCHLRPEAKHLPSAFTEPASRRLSQPMWEGMKDPSLPLSSVTATHLASPGRLMHLYYGPTSHFALMQTVYRDLIPGYGEEISGVTATTVEEGNAGLDMFKFRDIFFGISDSDSHRESSCGRRSGLPIFIPYPVAKALLFRFLETLYYLMPFQPQEVYEERLNELYKVSYRISGAAEYQVLLMAMAIAALNTEHFHLADYLFESVHTHMATMAEIVNLETVQYAHFQNERGNPNSAYLHLGTAARKALSAGFHRITPISDPRFVETRNTMWALYIFEVMVSFFLGRPASLSWEDMEIQAPDDPFLLCLVRLTRIMSRSAKAIYGSQHNSFGPVRQAAASIRRDLTEFESLMKQNMGVGVNSDFFRQEKGICQTILTSLYCHTLLLTYRPFLILRVKLQKMFVESNKKKNDASHRQNLKIPQWLNEVCSIAITAARDTIHHISRASAINPPVQELRYHGFFIGGAVFALICDMLHDPFTIAVHQPWINMGVQYLRQMREGEPIASTISAIELALKKLNQRQMCLDLPIGESSEIEGDATSSEDEDLNAARHDRALNHPPAPAPVSESLSTTMDTGRTDDQWRIDPSMISLEGFFSWPLIEPFG